MLGAGPAAAPVETWIQVAVARDFSGYKAQIAAFGRHHGARALEDLGPGCASLADALAVTLAIFLDPYASSPSAAPAPPHRAAAPPQPAPKAHLQRARPWLPQLTLDAAAGIGVSLLEHSEPLLTGSIGVRFDPRWSLAAGGTFVLPDTKSTDSGDVTLKLSYAYLLGCGRALGSNDGTRLDWCAAPLLGSLGGTGKNYQHNSSRRSVWLAIAAGPEVVFPFSRTLAWLLGGQAVVPLIRQGFNVESNGVRNATGPLQSPASSPSASEAAYELMGGGAAVTEAVKLASFEASYREHFAFAWRALRRLGVAERDLADATQDVFVVMYRKFQELDSERPIASYIYAICLRVASDRRRSAAQRHELLAEDAEPAEASEQAPAAHVTQQQNAERRALLEAALEAMPPEQRAVFTLFELEGRTGEEVAALLNVPAATVHSRLRLAREVFRRSIERDRARDQFEMRRMGGDR